MASIAAGLFFRIIGPLKYKINAYTNLTASVYKYQTNWEQWQSLLVRNGSSKCKHPISDSSSFTFSITFRIQTVIIICKRNSPNPQWSKDQSVGSYCSLLLTACSNMALRYVWQTLHVLTCSYNERFWMHLSWSLPLCLDTSSNYSAP